jgi:hypothetical protein
MVTLEKTKTFKALILFAILVGLQLFPLTGIFMMMFAAPLWVGFMPHIVAIALFYDLIIHKAPKYLLIIPILPYLIYYGFFFAEHLKISAIEKDIKSQNPATIVEYNPDQHSLIIDNMHFNTSYEVPVTYSPNSNYPEGFISYRLATQPLCKRVRNLKGGVRTWGVNSGSVLDRSYKSFRNICNLQMPEKPTKQLLKIETLTDDNKAKKLRKTQYAFFLDDEPIGKYTSATYKALPIFPQLIIGCALISSPAEWKCFFELNPRKKKLDVFPTTDKKTNNYLIAARVLNIRKYEDKDLRYFSDSLETVDKVEKLIEKRKN